MVGFLRRTSYTFYLPILFHYFSPKKLFVKMIESWIDFFFFLFESMVPMQGHWDRKEKTTTTTNRYLGAAITGSVRTKLKKKKIRQCSPNPITQHLLVASLYSRI